VIKMAAVATRFPANASIYELVRTGHGSLKSLSEVGLSREDLDLRVRDAAQRTGLAVDTLTSKLDS
jgi:hypothetical protein